MPRIDCATWFTSKIIVPPSEPNVQQQCQNYQCRPILSEHTSLFTIYPLFTIYLLFTIYPHISATSLRLRSNNFQPGVRDIHQSGDSPMSYYSDIPLILLNSRTNSNFPSQWDSDKQKAHFQPLHCCLHERVAWRVSCSQMSKHWISLFKVRAKKGALGLHYHLPWY